MTENEIVHVVESASPHADKLFKLVLGTIAGYATTQLVEKAITIGLEKYRNRNVAAPAE